MKGVNMTQEELVDRRLDCLAMASKVSLEGKIIETEITLGEVGVYIIALAEDFLQYIISGTVPVIEQKPTRDDDE